MKTYLDTKTIIINTMKIRNETFVPIEDLQDIMIKIREQLEIQGKLENYHIWYVEDYHSIINSISFNNDILEFNEYSQNIFLRKEKIMDVLADNYKVDETIAKIIQNCVNHTKGE